MIPHAYGIEVLFNPGRPSEHWCYDDDESATTLEQAREQRQAMVDRGYDPAHLRIVALTVVEPAPVGEPVVTHAWPNGSVDVALTLTYTAGSPVLAERIAADVRAELVAVAGTLHVPALTTDRVRLPHSRACGWRAHDHGPGCHTNCPTCGGQTP